MAPVALPSICRGLWIWCLWTPVQPSVSSETAVLSAAVQHQQLWLTKRSSPGWLTLEIPQKLCLLCSVNKSIFLTRLYEKYTALFLFIYFFFYAYSRAKLSLHVSFIWRLCFPVYNEHYSLMGPIDLLFSNNGKRKWEEGQRLERIQIKLS